jgi:surfeit locus 1 family protein
MNKYEWVKPKTVPIISTFLAIIIMFGLGAWQLHRLEWKQDIINKVESSKLSKASSVESLDLKDPVQHEFAKVSLTGSFDLDKPLFVAARYFRGALGYHVLLPFKLKASGQVVLVNTGWIPEEQKKLGTPRNLPGIEVSFSGLLRVANRKGGFIPDNKDNLWFWYDIPAMEKATGYPLLPVVIDRLDPQTSDHLPEVMYPVGFDGNIQLRNDHLQYAVTWFGIGFAALVIFIIAHTRRKSS